MARPRAASSWPHRARRLFSRRFSVRGTGMRWPAGRICDGDANMRSVWLCTRNDAIGNVAVMLAAPGVFGAGSAWPDLAVALVMGGLAVSGAWQVIGQARAELKAA